MTTFWHRARFDKVLICILWIKTKTFKHFNYLEFSCCIRKPLPWNWTWTLGSTVCFQSLQRPDTASAALCGEWQSTAAPPRRPGTEDERRLTECSPVMQTYISPAHFQINFFICIPSFVHMGSGCWCFYSKTLRNVAILSRPRSLNVTFKGSSGAELRLAFSFQSLSQQPTCMCK